jgi:hypothetical protein
MAEELDWLAQMRERTHSIVGFAVTLDLARREGECSDRLSTALIQSFLGPYPPTSWGGRKGQLDWDIAFPEQADAVSTWSFFDGPAGVCLIEGEFYASAWGYRPNRGEDTQFASLLWQRIKSEGPIALAELNGAFSGWFFDQESETLIGYVDPAGIRPLHYRHTGRCIEVVSNLYGLAARQDSFSLDTLALHQQLVFGEPLDGRTLFSGVKRLTAGRFLEFSGGLCTLHRYFHFPPRKGTGSLKDAAETLCSSVEAHIDRMKPFFGEETGIALSGGKDSRLILASLLAKGIKPRAYHFHRPEDRDLLIVQKLCRSVHIPCSLVYTSVTEDSMQLFSDAAVLMEGLFGASPFLLLAALSARFSGSLLTGYYGTVLSGDIGGFRPWTFKTADRMALAWLEARTRILPAEVVNQLLCHDLRVSWEDLKVSWLGYYQSLCMESEDPFTVFAMSQIEESLAGSPIFQMMRSFTTLIHPYADSQVMDAYLRLPPRFFSERRAHSLATRLRFPEFGILPTSPSGVALQYEHFFLPLIETYRWYRRLCRRKREQRLLSRFRSPQFPSQQATALANREGLIRILEESELTQPDAFRKYKGLLSCNRDLKLDRFASTAVAIACAQGHSLPAKPPFFFLNPASRS